MYLGLDLGTSGVKALLIDGEQEPVASASSDITVSRPHDGWSEQEPADWVRAAEDVVGALRHSHAIEIAAVRGIGLSGQMHGATLIDSAGGVMRPSILWNDTRSFEEAEALDRDPIFREVTGNIVFPGFTAPKLVWLRRHEPQIFDRVAKVLLPKDYLRFWLTGEFVAEMSDAAGTSWLDVGGRQWSMQLLDKCGLELAQMPSLIEGTEVSGVLRPELASRWGMKNKVVVAGGAGDNAASACGVGAVRSGEAFLSIGTSGVLFAANDRYSPNAASAVHTFCHALPEVWHQMGVTLSAADSLSWLSAIVGSPASRLADELGDQLRAPTGVTFLPYLSGERTPHNDASIRGALTGLSHQSDREALTQAVMEGVAFSYRDCLEALKSSGTTIDRVTAVGGGSRSHYWVKAIATALEIPLDLPAEGDFGAALGAARLGLIAAEGADPVQVCSRPAMRETIEPDTSLHAAFEDAYQRYRDLYPAIRSIHS